jgi:hypothetical protein
MAGKGGREAASEEIPSINRLTLGNKKNSPY